MGLKRIVLDTSALVSGAYDDVSAGRRIMDACVEGELIVLASPELRAEYERIATRVRVKGFAATFQKFLAATETVRPTSTPRVVPDDPDDDRVIAAAVAGGADAIVTTDQHLLELNPYGRIRVLRPREFLELHADDQGDTWTDLARLIGIRH